MVYTPTPTPTPPPPSMVVDINAPMVETTDKKLVSLRHRNTARNGHGKKRTRPVYKLAKRQDNLELSYLCSIFVSLKEWQDTDTTTNHGKAMTRTRTRQVGVVTTPRHGKARKKHTARQGSLQLGDERVTIWNCHIFVVPLYRCRKHLLKLYGKPNQKRCRYDTIRQGHHAVDDI